VVYRVGLVGKHLAVEQTAELVQLVDDLLEVDAAAARA